jgi:hypothetical protein
MSISQINQLVHQVSQAIIEELLLQEERPVTYNDRNEINGSFESIFDHVGIYALILKKNGQKAIAYIGKSEEGDRLRQHLTGKNKDGTQLASSVSTKHIQIKESILAGYEVFLSLYANKNFNKASLMSIENVSIFLGIENLGKSFPDLETWNKRNG